MLSGEISVKMKKSNQLSWFNSLRFLTRQEKMGLELKGANSLPKRSDLYLSQQEGENK